MCDANKYVNKRGDPSALEMGGGGLTISHHKETKYVRGEVRNTYKHKSLVAISERNHLGHLGTDGTTT